MADQISNGEQTFLDQNGKPLSSGFVYMYVPNTSNFSTTWQDPGATIINTNPVVLDQAGRASIWGIGQYRQVVTDQFGNVQWDRVVQAGITGSDIIGNVSINGSLTVSGASSFNGTVTTGGVLNANAGIVSGGEIHLLNGQILVADGLIYANAGIQSAGQIHLLGNNLLVADGGINSAGVINANGGLSVSTVSALAGQTVIGLNNELVVQDPGRTIRIVSGNNPSLSLGNTVLQTNAGVWNAGDKLTWGPTDASGNPATSLMSLRIEGVGVGNLSVSGDITPFSNEGSSLGEIGEAWNNVVAHNYITVSTSADSELVEDGALEVVKRVPVKKEPHIGIAKEDLVGHDWSKVESNGGVNYNVVAGMLWKALQELSAKFDVYVASHP